MYQWDRIENPEINPHIYSQLIFFSDVKTIRWGKEQCSADGAGTDNNEWWQGSREIEPYILPMGM